MSRRKLKKCETKLTLTASTKDKRTYCIPLIGNKHTHMKRSRTIWCLPPTVSSACLLPVENFSQRVSLIREVRNAETKENSLRRINNNNVVIKHSQGPLVLSQGL